MNRSLLLLIMFSLSGCNSGDSGDSVDSGDSGDSGGAHCSYGNKIEKYHVQDSLRINHVILANGCNGLSSVITDKVGGVIYQSEYFLDEDGEKSRVIFSHTDGVDSATFTSHLGESLRSEGVITYFNGADPTVDVTLDHGVVVDNRFIVGNDEYEGYMERFGYDSILSKWIEVSEHAHII